MFKRVEKKRKKREEEEELGLDDDMKEIMGLNDSDSDESDSGSESDRRTSDEEHVHPGDQGDGDEEEAGSEEIDEQPPMPVHEALKNPIYLISLDPTIYGCILCKGKLLKNAEMAVVHKDATAHKRRLERFKALASIADPDSDAWGIAKASQAQSALVDQPEPQTLSRRALKRPSKQQSKTRENFTNS
ncbi:hypothetical protein F5I97DRAFT_1450679 [Phlebopus sp. FC_14]|nr:hypothetical protein F5I97DRAFT_1450679 [Phlebopus sp. FC_14]